MPDPKRPSMFLATTTAMLACATPAQARAQGAALPGESATAAAGYDGGFFLRSPDRANELVVEGLLQFGANAFDPDRDPSTELDTKRLRLEFSARIEERLRAHLEPNFLPEGTEMEEAWFGLDLFDGDALLMFGRMKAPFGLEEVRSRRWIHFPRFSILNQLSPAEDHGVFLNGLSRSKVWEYGVAAYNGTGGADANSSKDVAARVMVHPFAGDTGALLEHLQLGIAATAGRADDDVGGSGVQNELKLPVIEFATGTELDGGRTRAGIEAAWWRGPWFVQAEYVVVEQAMGLESFAGDVRFHGGYVDVSYVLTGEEKSFRGLTPASPRDWRRGAGRGAWLLAARWSELAVDDELAALSVPGTFTDRIRTASIGLDWFADRHVAVRTAFVRTLYDDEVSLGGGSRDREDAFLVELQLSF